MIEVFLLVGWVDGFKSGGVVNIEFASEAACIEAKDLFQTRHDMKSVAERYDDDDWVECVKK
jgi:hypothetical protein